MAQGLPFALVTISAADGGPRSVGAQMVVTETDSWGFVSGGCIEADVTTHARRTLADGEPRRLVYGHGSPWVDTRLPCGGRLDLLVELATPNDPQIREFVTAHSERKIVRYRTDGAQRLCTAVDEAAAGPWVIDHVFNPPQRVIVFGSDPIALAIATLASRLDWSSVLVAPDGPFTPPDPGVAYRIDCPRSAMADLAPDAHTAIAVATHDTDYDEQAIVAALATDAGYIGVLGARRRIPDRLARLRRCGISEGDIGKLHMPIGLPLGAATPWEIAVSVTAEIIQKHRAQKPRTAVNDA